MFFGHGHEYRPRSQAMEAVTPKIGCSAETLRSCVLKVERDGGSRPGQTITERDRLKERERKVRELHRPNGILRKAPALLAPAELDHRGG